MNEELKSCPHCGNEAYSNYTIKGGRDWYLISCTSCRAGVGEYRDNIDAINNWNQRVTDDTCNDLIKLVKWLMDGGLSDNPDLSINTHDLLRKHGIDV